MSHIAIEQPPKGPISIMKSSSNSLLGSNVIKNEPKNETIDEEPLITKKAEKSEKIKRIYSPKEILELKTPDIMLKELPSSAYHSISIMIQVKTPKHGGHGSSSLV